MELETDTDRIELLELLAFILYLPGLPDLNRILISYGDDPFVQRSAMTVPNFISLFLLTFTI